MNNRGVYNEKAVGKMIAILKSLCGSISSSSASNTEL
jgi:hypothetical protein